MSQQAPLTDAIDVFRPGNFEGPTIESEKLGIVLNPFAGPKHNAVYELAGPAGTDLTAIQYNNETPGQRSVHVAYDETRRINPRNRDFKLHVVFKSLGVQPENIPAANLFTVQDEDGVVAGCYRTYITSTRWYLNIFDRHGNEHNTYWDSSGAGHSDTDWYHMEWVIDKDQATAGLNVNGDPKVTSLLNKPLTDIGSINPSRPTVLIGGDSNQSSSNRRFNGLVSDIAVGKKNYNWPSVI